MKLTSGCPHWWNLSALKHHLLTLPLPTNLAIYFYHLPDGYLKLTTAFVQLSEILIPWLFFAPIRSFRIFAFYWQLFLQLCIVATGNYGFLNFMIMAMLLSLLDDSFFQARGSQSRFRKAFSIIQTLFIVFIVMSISTVLYKFTMIDGNVNVEIRKKSFQLNIS